MRPLASPRLARFVLGGLLVLCLVGGVGALFRAVVQVHGLPTAELASAAWGALILASFVGWGGLINAMVFPRSQADAGLRCAWGWGVAVAAGGLACALGVATRRALFGFVAQGLLFLLVEAAQRALAWARGSGLRRRRLHVLAADAPFLAGAAAIFLLGVLLASASVFNRTFNVNDDNLAYFQFAREILDRGTLTQPFSLRRISAYSGKSVLDAIQLAIDVPETHLHLLDKGLATLTILALVLGQARAARRGARGIYLLAMLFVVSIPDTGINTSSMRTAVVFFLGLYRTLAWAPVAATRGIRAAVPVALLAAGACTLRQNYLTTIAALLVVAYSQPILRGLRLRPFHVDRGALRDAGLTAALLALLLVPWWAMSYRWCGTFLFPARRGFYNPAYSFFPHLTLAEWISYVWVNATYNMPVKATPLFLVAALTLRDGQARRPLAATLIAAFAGFAMLLYGYPAADLPNQGRYHFGFTFAAILVIVLAAAEVAGRRVAPGRRRSAQLVCVCLVVFGMAMQLYDDRERVGSTYKGFITQVFVKTPTWVRSDLDPVYKTLQSPVPAAVPIAAMVDDPSRFDYRRNRIACLDMIGAVSPPPGIPLAAGGEAVADYLLRLGYRYLIVVDPGAARSIYRRDLWVGQLKASEKVWRDSAHFYLEAFDAFDTLRKTRVHLADASGMVTLDLATRAP